MKSATTHLFLIFIFSFGLSCAAKAENLVEKIQSAGNRLVEGKMAASKLVVTQSVKKISFSFENAELSKIVSVYAKVSGQRFVIDPSFRGKATILLPGPVSIEDAFSLMSTALASNQFAISERGDTMVIMSARNVQRSLIPTTSQLPPLNPEKMIMMIFQLKHVSAEEMNRRLRILPSKDGEITPFEQSNKLLVTDWVSNVHRIAKVIAELDQPKSNDYKRPPESAAQTNPVVSESGKDTSGESK